VKILRHPIEQRYWWIFYPTVIAARVRAICWPDPRDRLCVIWVRPLGKDEMQQLNKLTGEA
jgi:hypothetical protein